jgi:hypothetical protein
VRNGQQLLGKEEKEGEEEEELDCNDVERRGLWCGIGDRDNLWPRHVRQVGGKKLPRLYPAL